MPRTLQGRVRFGPFELDPRAGELHHSGRAIVLQEQQLKVLLMLIEREGKIATREEIRKQLWPNDTIVEFDSGINQTIRKLRQALDDSADRPRYIETIARRGYRLMVAVEWIHSSDDSSSGGFSAEGGTDSAEGSGDNSQASLKARLKVGQLTGKTVSHYRVLEIIGAGGMGLVYRAEDLKLGRAVALKFLPEEVGDDARVRERFEREAQAVSTLNHPNICTIHEFGEHEGQPFISMELLQGKTLRDHLADGRFRLTQPDGLEIAIQIAAGLEAAHEKGIIHRDIKPANIFITEKNVAKILDFGVAKVIQLVEPQHAAAATASVHAEDPTVTLSDHRRDVSSDLYRNDDEGINVLRLRSSADSGLAPLRMTNEDGAAASPNNLTRTGMKLGTAGYMSPEQIRGEPLDARTDIFSFGLVLYEMATGNRAFRGETEALLHEAIEHRNPKPARELAPEISLDLQAFITKCLEKHREQRFQTVAEVRGALQSLDYETCFTPPLKEEQRKRSHHRMWMALIVTAAMLSMLAVVFVYRRQLKRPRLTNNDTVVLADVTNRTGDPVFDQSLSQALMVALGQSPFFRALSKEKVFRTLEQMHLSSKTPLSFEVANDVCVRTNSKLLIAGSISDLGNQYQMELRTINCSTGELLGSVTAKVDERNRIIHDLGIAALQLRENMGEPTESVNKFNQPLELATTTSVNALRAYAEGHRMLGKPEAIPFLARAVELDPNFALAYDDLATDYYNVKKYGLAHRNADKAYELRGRLTLPCRYSVEKGYYRRTGDIEKMLAMGQQWRELYPNSEAHNTLSFSSRLLGRLEQATTEGREAVRVAPDDPRAYINLAEADIMTDQYDEARTTLLEAKSRGVESRWLAEARYQVAFLLSDRDAMKQELRAALGKPGTEDLLLATHAYKEALQGHRINSRRGWQLAIESAKRANASSEFAGWQALEALQDAEFGEDSRATGLASEALKSSGDDGDKETRITVALALARSGATDNALQVAANLDQDLPNDTLWKNYHFPLIRAAVELQRREPGRSIELLKVAVPYELGGGDPSYLYPAYIRGLAFIQAGNWQEAVREFQKMVDHPGVALQWVTGALAHLQLGRAQVMMGDKEAARKSYQNFLTLWKDADPDIPIYQQAKAEYKKLVVAGN